MLIGGLASAGVLRLWGLWGLARAGIILLAALLVFLAATGSRRFVRRRGKRGRIILLCTYTGLALAVGLALFPYVRQSIAVARLEKAGWKVQFAFEQRSITESPGIAENLFGKTLMRFFSNRCNADIMPHGLSQDQLAGVDAQLRHLRHLRGLRRLLIYAPISDAGAAHLRGLKTLEAIYLQDSTMTDEGLKSLSQLPNLKVLDVPGTQITDDGLAAISSLPLKYLNVTNTSVGDKGLDHLARMPLQQIGLGGTQITDRAAAKLLRYRTLHSITLEKTQITSAGMAQLSQARNLCYVYASQTPFAEEGGQFKAPPWMQIVTSP